MSQIWGGTIAFIANHPNPVVDQVRNHHFGDQDFLKRLITQTISMAWWASFEPGQRQSGRIAASGTLQQYNFFEIWTLTDNIQQSFQPVNDPWDDPRLASTIYIAVFTL